MGRGAPATLGTAEVALVLPALRALDARGVAAGSVLSAAGITADHLSRADDRLPYERVLAFWEGAARAAGDPAFGLHVATTMPVGALDLLDYLFCTSPTLLAAHQRIAKYVRIFVDSTWHNVTISGALVKIARFRRIDAGVIGRQYREFITAATVRRGRDSTGVHWVPRRVVFGHPAHEAREELDRFFGVRVEYDRPADDVWIDRKTAALPLRSSDSRLSAVLIRYADSLLAKIPDRTGFVALARRAIAGALAAGGVSVAKGAARLGMSARTFQRRLASHRTSHHRLLDETRYDLASAYLCDPTISITQLTFMLDFADVSAFTRAFKRWSGMTPSEFRRRHVKEGASSAMAAMRGKKRGARSRPPPSTVARA
jgi:AraC-like DNA-binding protein